MRRALSRWIVAGLIFTPISWTQAVPATAQETSTTSEPQGFVEEPDLVERLVIFLDRRSAANQLGNGLYADSWNMITGAGWIATGPGYRRWFGNDHLFTDASAAISWRGYKTAQARVELPALARSRLTLGSQVKFQDFTHVAFFGEGPASLESNQSEYHLRSGDVVGDATVRPVRWLGLGGEIGWMRPYLPAGQPAFIYSDVSITADRRDFPSRPTRGGLVHASFANYADRQTGAFSFRRYEAETAGFLPLAGAHVVVALHGWLAASSTDAGQAVPFYLEPNLGGQNTIRGYADYRFHDRNLALINAEARFAMMTHVDAAIFVDAGNVAPTFGNLNLDKRSYGAGLRLHSRRQTFARLDVARGSEGWRAFFQLTDPLDLVRLSRRTAPVPFVP